MKHIFSTLVILLGLSIQQNQAQEIPPLTLYKLDFLYDDWQQVYKEVNKYEIKLKPDQEAGLLKRFLESNIDYADYIVLSKHWSRPVSPETRARIAQLINNRISKEKDPDIKANLEFTKKKILEKKDVSALDPNSTASELFPVRVLDFNQDQEVDMLWFPRVYFGPSVGYYMYTRQGDQFKYVFDQSASLTQLQINTQRVLLRLHILPFDDKEPNILQTIVYDFQAKKGGLGPKQYYASKLQIPNAIENPHPVEIKSQVALRSQPQVDDRPRDESQMDTTTRHLRGNVVADIAPPSKAFVLAEEGNWVLVAFAPDSKILALSLVHGMDALGIDEKGNWKGIQDPQPYL
ncbi:MAG: hypothetical protein AAFU64_12010 [Bacteroidota bacterium]